MKLVNNDVIALRSGLHGGVCVRYALRDSLQDDTLINPEVRSEEIGKVGAS